MSSNLKSSNLEAVSLDPASSFGLFCSLASLLQHSRSLFSTLSIYIAKKRLPAAGRTPAGSANLEHVREAAPPTRSLEPPASSFGLFCSLAPLFAIPLFVFNTFYLHCKKTLPAAGRVCLPKVHLLQARRGHSLQRRCGVVSRSQLSIRGWALALRPCSIVCMLARDLRTPKQNPEEAFRKRMVCHGRRDRCNS